MPESQIECCRTRVISLSVIAILVTGTLIGLASVLPHYFASKQNLEQFNALHAQAIASAIDSEMSRYLDISRQIASRSEIRKRLEQYAAGTLDYQALVDYSGPRLTEAIRDIPDLVAATRLGPARETIFTHGAQIASDPLPGTRLRLFAATLGAQERWLLQANTRLYAEDGKRAIGTDLLYFTATELNRQLGMSSQFGTDAKLYLLDRHAARLLASDGESLHPQPLPAALAERLPADEPGTAPSVLYYRTMQGPRVVFYKALERFDGALLLEIPEAVLYAPALRDLLRISLLTLLMMLLASLLTRHALKPLIDRLIAQARKIQESNAELQLAASVFESTQEGIVITDFELKILRINEAFSEILGYDARTVVGKPLSTLFEAKYRAAGTLEAIFERLEREDAWQGEIWYHHPNDGEIPALQTISAVRDPAHRIVRLIHIFNDISEHKASEQRMQRLAHFDALTGLANRATLQQRIGAALVEARNNGESLALLFLDLDKFKPVNDSLGHGVGDEVLKAVARRIANTVRDSDLIGRLGGDEFLLLLNGAHPRDYAGVVAQKLIDQLSQPFQIGEHRIQIGASVGIALFPEDADSVEELIHRADEAMYHSKRSERIRYHYCSSN